MFPGWVKNPAAYFSLDMEDQAELLTYVTIRESEDIQMASIPHVSL